MVSREVNRTGSSLKEREPCEVFNQPNQSSGRTEVGFLARLPPLHVNTLRPLLSLWEAPNQDN